MHSKCKEYYQEANCKVQIDKIFVMFRQRY